MTLGVLRQLIVRADRKLGHDSQASLGVAGVCFVIGAASWGINWVVPGSTMLDSFLVVSAMYLAIGAESLLADHLFSEKRAGGRDFRRATRAASKIN